jgi:tight adherence protein B
MTGGLLGVLLGTGLVLLFVPARQRATVGRRDARMRDWLAQAGLTDVTPVRLIAACVGVGLVGATAMALLSRSVVVGLAFGVLAAALPVAAVNLRRRRRADELRDAWPEAVDNLASGVRAGLSLPEALGQLGVRGPEPLRPAFAAFQRDYRVSGSFLEALDRLKSHLADPVGDRVIESLRLAREVGGSDLGRLLRTLSGFLREDARTRAELQSRQSWTVNAARLAVAAPWVLLGLLSLRPEAVRAYDSAAGAVILLGGAGLCIVAYRLMVRLGRLPREQRVLR